MIPIPRFIAKAREFSVTCWRTVDRETSFQTGLDVQVGFIADFRHDGSLSPWEKEAALKTFNFGAVGHDEDVTHRLSVFDTDHEAMVRKWTPEFKQRVEDALRQGRNLGRSYLEVDQPRRPAPWPAYDKLVAQGRRTSEMVAERIAATVTENGYDAGEVLSYERENHDRPEVIAALEALGVAEPEEELVSA